ncbi:MAG TPA: RNA methyltransferase, partial [Algoriphagus sp.]|nr:RNA methyltransferase [Algoriphagus sp.]
MLSKNTVKFIKSLHQKKYRAEHQKFFVEGEKSVVEVINSDFIIDFLVATPDFIERHNVLLKKCSFEIIQATKNQ